MKDFGKVHHFADFWVLILFSLISSSSTNTPPSWTIHSSDIQTWVSFLSFEFKFGICIWQIKYWTYLNVAVRALTVAVVLCVHMLESCTCISVWFCFVSFCVSHPPLFSPVLPLLSPHHARHAPAAPTLRTLQLAARSLPAQGQPHIPTLNPRSTNRQRTYGSSGTKCIIQTQATEN